MLACRHLTIDCDGTERDETMAWGIIMTGMTLLAMLGLTMFNYSVNPDIATGAAPEEGDATAGWHRVAA